MNFAREMEKEVGHRPYWFMRQAGRYLPEYKSLRDKIGLNLMFSDPQIVASVTELPVKYFDPDYLVLYTDILLSLELIGFKVDFENGLSIERNNNDSSILKILKSSIRKIKKDYPRKRLIGITGGPFTLMSYVFDGHDKGYKNTKKEIIENNENVRSFIKASIEFAKSQIDSGCDIIQVFESWIGNLSSSDYKEFMHDYEYSMIKELKRLGKPVIFFGENLSHLLPYVIELNADAISLDWRIDLRKLYSEYPYLVIQGNLDPWYLFLKDDILRDKVKDILRYGNGFAGHVFNLGHGIPPEADYRKLILISKVIREYE